jgi:hypothetical protein
VLNLTVVAPQVATCSRPRRSSPCCSALGLDRIAADDRRMRRIAVGSRSR